MQMNKEVKKKFLKKISIKGEDDCWLWIGAKNGRGYGNFSIQGKTYLAHRLMWQLNYGEILNDLFVCHKCDTPLCCNPKHLFLGTHQDNMQDMKEKGRTAKYDRHGSKNSNAKLNEQTVKQLREMYATGKYTQVELGTIFGIHPKYVSVITLGNIWK